MAKKTTAKKTAAKAVKTPGKKATKKPASGAKKRQPKEKVVKQNPPCDCEANAELGISAPKTPKSGLALKVGAKASDWRVAKSLLKLREQVNAMAPGRDKSSDGTIGDGGHQGTNSDHNPWVDEGVVTAMDITHDPKHNCDSGALAESIRASRDGRVKYIIWNRRICNHASIGGAAAWAWRPYTGTNPHDKHVHISVKSTKAQYDDESNWAV